MFVLDRHLPLFRLAAAAAAFVLYCREATGGAREVRMAVVVSGQKATETEREFVQALVAGGLKASRGCLHVDRDTMQKLKSDEAVEPLLRGDMTKLQQIERKYRIHVIVSIAVDVEAVPGIGPYALASASTTVKCLRTDKGILFDEKTSAPQSGFYGIPECLGSTEQAARQAAIQTAIQDALGQADVEVGLAPLQPKIELALVRGTVGTRKMTRCRTIGSGEAERFVDMAQTTPGQRTQVSLGTLSPTRSEIVAVGLLESFRDLRRNRRTDTAKVAVLSARQRREIRQVELPRKRRSGKRAITAVTFSPNCRFLAIADQQPWLFIYDVWTGHFVAETKLPDAADSVTFSSDMQFVAVDNGDVAFKLQAKRK